MIEIIPHIYFTNNISSFYIEKYNINYIVKFKNDYINIPNLDNNIDILNIEIKNNIIDTLKSNYIYFNDKIIECIKKNKNILFKYDKNNISLILFYIFCIKNTDYNFNRINECIESKLKIKYNFSNEIIEFINNIN